MTDTNMDSDNDNEINIYVVIVDGAGRGGEGIDDRIVALTLTYAEACLWAQSTDHQAQYQCDAQHRRWFRIVKRPLLHAMTQETVVVDACGR
jgi:hypothetical protein